MKVAQALAPYSSRLSPNRFAPLPLGSMRENGGPWLVGIPTLHAGNPNRNTSCRMPARRALRQLYYLFLTPLLKLVWPLERPLSERARYIHLVPVGNSCQRGPHRRERSSGLCRSLARRFNPFL